MSFWITLFHQPVNKLSALHATWEFITAFTTALHLSLSWVTSSQVTNFQHFFLIHKMITHLRVGFQNILSPSHFPTKPCTQLPSTHSATGSAYVIPLHFITHSTHQTLHIKQSPPLPCYLHHNPQYTSWHSTLSSLHHSHVISTPLAPNISLSLCSAFNMKEKL